jgi:serine/threonine protein kinase
MHPDDPHRSGGVDDDDSTAVPIAQSRVATEVAPAAMVDPRGDPMASIRPQLPESPPLLAPTLELSHLVEGSGHGAQEPTLVPQASKREQLAHPTHVPGPVIAVVGPDASSAGNGELDGASYQLHRQIGVGGMGEVWEARQRELGRTVALKRLRSGKQSASNVRLFKSEARLTAILDHPNIVTVHELGRDQAGHMFYTMKLIEGTPWSDVLAAGERRTGDGELVKLELRDHLDILVEVSQAIAFAHSRGVIHRDIKPGNVMIGDYGEIQVVDWGLAVALFPLDALGRTETWTLADLPTSALVCGTPAYMSPETAMAKRDLIGPATDVYLLGAVLFHLLYGRPPHKGKSVDAVLSKAKVNAWVIPEENISGRLRPWDALLRPVINRALASEPADRYADAEDFREALRRAIRNYESAKVASRAQEELAELAGRGTEAYSVFAGMITRLEGALESWPRNLAARQTLAHARIELARVALRNGDLSLTRVALDAFEKMPPLPEPEPGRVSRRLTIHPVDGTLINAPRPTDSLVAAGTSNQWVSSLSDLGSPAPSGSSLARTIDAVDLAAARSPGSDSRRILLGRAGASLNMGRVASVEIQQDSDASMLDDAQQLAHEAVRLRREADMRERSVRRRRKALYLAGALVGALTIAVTVTGVRGQAALHRERDRAQAERDKLSKVLLDETANTVEAQLDVLFEPVDAALTTALRWASAGDLDSDDPRELNRYFIPLLSGVEAASSTLRADAAGYEYMLLSQPNGWRTRSTTPGTTDTPPARTQREWSPSGELREHWLDETPYDPHGRPWYVGGHALRGQASADDPHPVYWTPPYRFFTTQELGISVSAPAMSPSGRELVLAFDIKLGDISDITSKLPDGIEQGQVFVLDERLQVLALPRETATLTPERRDELLLDPMIELADAPIASAATRKWQELGEDGPFRLELGNGVEHNYWVGFRKIDKPHRPPVWIGVVVPESHFLE